jgi:hypothetical protein
MSRLWAVLVGVLAMLTVAGIPPTTTASAAIFTYDASTFARVDVHEFEAAGAGPAHLSGSRERSASPPAAARGMSSTPSGSFIATEAASPVIDPAEVAGMSPAEVDAFARENGLIPKGPDPAAGRGAYVDPVTGQQRILCHPDGCGGVHLHVNDPTGQRLDIGGNPVAPESPAAHLPGRFSPR